MTEKLYVVDGFLYGEMPFSLEITTVYDSSRSGRSTFDTLISGAIGVISIINVIFLMSHLINMTRMTSIAPSEYCFSLS